MEQLDSHFTDNHEIWYLRIFRKYVEKIQVSLKSGKNNKYFMGRSMYMCHYIALNSSSTEKFLRQICRENQNTNFYIEQSFSKIVPFMR